MKTIEEAAKEYQTKIYEDVFEEGSLSEQKLQCINDFKAGIAFAEEWISVEDELPENDNIILVKTNLGCVATAYLHGKKSGFIVYGDEAYKEFGNITHWRPINRK